MDRQVARLHTAAATNLVYHLAVEACRPPSWLSAVPRDQHVNRLRSNLRDLAQSTSLRWLDDSTLAIRLRYRSDRLHARERHQEALDAVCRALNWAGLYPKKAVVKRVATHWTLGAVAGALTGLGLSRTQEENVQPAVALAGVLLGAVVGAFVRREAPVYRAAQLPATGWRLIAVEPEATSSRYRLGPA